MEKLSLKKAAEGNDRGARQRLVALESQLEGEPSFSFDSLLLGAEGSGWMARCCKTGRA